MTPVNLPQTMPRGGNMPAQPAGPSPAEQRAEEITKIQRDIAKRRRRKIALLFTRLAFFVFLPTLIVGWYYHFMATPMYSTKSEFLILKADGGGGGAGMGGLLSGTQFATNQDAIAVQSYLGSKDAMLRLDEDEGFRMHFSQADIDAVQRLDPEGSNEDAYKIYKKMVQIGYDPTEGVIKMEVIAADPTISARFSDVLIQYAEERVDNLSLRKRENQMADAMDSFEAAEENRRARPNRAKVEGAQGDVRRLQDLLVRLNGQMSDAATGENSLAELAAQIQLAQADVATRDLMMQSALEQLESTRREAASQARYLTTSVEPVASEDPAYPRKFENTILAFLVFAGIYLMISLTASILREQVSS